MKSIKEIVIERVEKRKHVEWEDIVDETLKEVLELIDERIDLHEQHKDVKPIPLIIRELKELKQRITEGERT